MASKEPSYHPMELADLLTRANESARERNKRMTVLLRLLTNCQCDWAEIKKEPNIRNTFQELFCQYEDLPLHINNDEDGGVVVKWRLGLGK